MYQAFAKATMTDKFGGVELNFSQYFSEVPYEISNLACR